MDQTIQQLLDDHAEICPKCGERNLLGHSDVPFDEIICFACQSRLPVVAMTGTCAPAPYVMDFEQIPCDADPGCGHLRLPSSLLPDGRRSLALLMDELIQNLLDDHAELCAFCGMKQFVPDEPGMFSLPMCPACMLQIRSGMTLQGQLQVHSDGTEIPTITFYGSWTMQ